jgi:uncharacterized membrane protein (UPF0182 family)
LSFCWFQAARARSAASRASLSDLPWRGLSITVSFLLLVIVALRVYVGRFEQLFEHHTIFDGVTYTDAHVTLAGMLVVSAALVLGAVIAAGWVACLRRAGAGWRRLFFRPWSVTLRSRWWAGTSPAFGQAQRTGARAALHRS